MVVPKTFDVFREVLMVRGLFLLLCATGAGLLSAVSIVLNFHYAQSQGETVLNGWLYGLAMGGGDALKCALPFLFAVAFAKRQWLVVAAIVPLFCLLTLFSLASAIGFAAENRGGHIDSREGAAARYLVVKASYDAAVQQQQSLATHRSRGEVESALRSLLLLIPEGAVGTVAKLSADCARPGPITRSTCTQVLALREELARAITAERLAMDIERDRLDLDRLIAAGALRSSDSQASAIAGLLARFGTDEKLVRSGLSWLMAIVIEAGSSLGLFVSSVALRRDEVEPVKAIIAAPLLVDPVPALPPPPHLPVAVWWHQRLHVDIAATLTFHEIFDDYQAMAVTSGHSVLPYGDFRQAFDMIAGRVALVVVGSQVQSVRLGAA